MKKKGLIIASLLILVLSVFFMGCPPEEKDPAALKEEATKALSDIGYPKDVPVPAGTTYDTCKGTATQVTIAWTGGDKPKFNAYASKFGVSRANLQSEEMESLTEGNLAAGFYGNVILVDDAGGTHPSSGIEAKPNSIILVIIKNP